MSKGRDRALFVCAHAAKPAPDVQILATINMHIIVLCLEQHATQAKKIILNLGKSNRSKRVLRLEGGARVRVESRETSGIPHIYTHTITRIEEDVG